MFLWPKGPSREHAIEECLDKGRAKELLAFCCIERYTERLL